MTVDQVERGQQQDGHDQQRRQQVTGRPEERHTVQQPDIQRRIAEWRQCARRVCDQHDHEHHQVHLPPAVRVGAQQRVDQHHRGAGRAHHHSHRHAQRQHRGVANRRSSGSTAQQHPSASGVEREQQRHEWQIVDQQRVPDGRSGRAEPARQRLGRQQRCTPGKRHDPHSPVPEAWRDDRQHRHRRQETREGYPPRQSGCA